jgi:hypothetical protein
VSGPLLGFASRAVRPSRTFITSPSVGRPTSFLPLRAAGRVVRSVVKPACFFRCVEAPSFCADVPTSWSDDPRARVLCATPQGAHSLVCGFGDHLTVTTQTNPTTSTKGSCSGLRLSRNSRLPQASAFRVLPPPAA